MFGILVRSGGCGRRGQEGTWCRILNLRRLVLCEACLLMNFEFLASRLITKLSSVVMKMLCRRGKDVFERYCLVDIGGCGRLTIAVVGASI